MNLHQAKGILACGKLACTLFIEFVSVIENLLEYVKQFVNHNLQIRVCMYIVR